MSGQESRDIWFEGVFMRVQASTYETGGSMSMMEQWLPASWSPPLHVHAREDQLLYVLEGELRVKIGDGDLVTVEAGSSVFLPRNVPHGVIAGPDGAKILEINTPGGFEQFHVDASEPATEARIPDPKDVDVDKLVAAIQPYDAQFVGPPLG